MSQSMEILEEAGRRDFIGCKEGGLGFLGGGIAMFSNLRMDISSLVYAVLCKCKTLLCRDAFFG